ncbi:MAG: prepilin-type N-terminal cleavage/methylation domain-containing protein [Planctomycetota bacterium]|jgi:general secretion pathway protein J|nr:prepilin-type N-terminal cleavage/methylation domain-containing protein [Planctomycetota bacterium]
MKRGFTLLELIVAMVLFSIVMSAAYALFDSGQSLSSDAQKVSAVQQEVRFVFETLRRDLQGAVGVGSYSEPAVYQFLGTNEGTEEEPLDEIRFLAMNRETFSSSVPESDLGLTRYYIMEEEDGFDQIGLVRIKNGDLLSSIEVENEDEEAQEIGPNVVFFGLRYFDGSDWQESWDSTLSLTLPHAVEITLTLRVPQSEDETQSFTGKIFLPVAAETPTLTEGTE